MQIPIAWKRDAPVLAFLVSIILLTCVGLVISAISKNSIYFVMFPIVGVLVGTILVAILFFRRKQRRPHVLMDIMVVIVLAVTGIISLYSSTIIANQVENELYLTYPHFGISVSCPASIAENSASNIVTSIENYGDYAGKYSLNVTSNTNVSFYDEMNKESDSFSQSFILEKGKVPQITIPVKYTDNDTNFTLTVSYTCAVIIPNKPDVKCDFWTASNSICEYRKSQGESFWRASNQSYY